ncbi:MAG: mucoidy inhibitor MuiA family protein [Deltaproteobacteria bacterium]|nr:mucoidy inhibitor MuiA family protein [Deltaproteobacteria bacterium]
MLKTVFAASLALALGGAAPETGSVPLSAAAKVLQQLPVHQVTVFSDRARVTRQGEVTFEAAEATRLALLPPTLDVESIRLEAEGAQVKRVEVRRAGLEEFPRSEAEQLIREIEGARDSVQALEEKRQALLRERFLLQGLRPSTAPQPDPKLGPVLLEPAGWKASVAFFDAREAALEKTLRGLEDKSRMAQQRLQQLCETASLLAAGTNAGQGWLVEAWLEGRGTARLSLSYVTEGARWYPAYDVRFNPGRAEVEVGFAALTTQQTGEDWADAKLSFSTAVPATTAALPKMLVWKIGEKDQFIPTPVARPEPPSPRPPAPEIDGARGRQDLDHQLRSRLLALATSSPPRDGAQAASTTIDLDDSTVEGELSAPEGSYLLNRKAWKDDAPMPSAPPPPPAPVSRAPGTKDKRKQAPPSAQPMTAPEPAAEPALERMANQVSGMVSSSSLRRAEGFAIDGPSGWSTPSFASDLPAALAGGYDFVYLSARRETLRSGPESRRVALHSAKLPAAARLAIFPALRKSAYLVADVTNSSERPLLSGSANLFVGADLQGQARIPTTAAGEKLTLPLGVDEGVQIERNVNVVTRETGLISKDDVTRYEVVIELLNPRAAPVEARVVDQVPLSGEKTVEVKLDRMEPWAIHDQDEGSLEWRLTLKPGAKQVIKFAYTVTRPRGAKLRQW